MRQFFADFEDCGTFWYHTPKYFHSLVMVAWLRVSSRQLAGGLYIRRYTDDRRAAERLHIGCRYVHDPTGSLLVIYWRAPVSQPFYRASPAEPFGVSLRRRYTAAGPWSPAHSLHWGGGRSSW